MYIFCSILYLGWTTTDTPDEPQMASIGDKMRDLAYEVHGTVYTSVKAIDLYPTTGAASDWYIIEILNFYLRSYIAACPIFHRFYSDDANVNNGIYRAAGFTIELRDTGDYGFLLPPEQVKSHHNAQLGYHTVHNQ